MTGTIEVFHGAVESLVRALKKGEDLFYGYHPELPTAIFSTDIRYSVIFSGEFSREPEYVTTWQIPIALLTLIDEGADGSRWYTPNLPVDDLETIPQAYLKHTKYQTVEKARVAVSKGEVIFVRTPNQYFRGAEEVDKILARFDEANRT